MSINMEAKIGHKTADTSFFGYKPHIAMTEERIITAAVITSGEKPDGKELDGLVTKSRQAGMAAENVVGDKAYSSKGNIDSSKEIGAILKHRHGYDIVSSSSLIGMETQGTLAIFAVNLKRIVKLMNEKKNRTHKTYKFPEIEKEIQHYDFAGFCFLLVPF